MLLQIILLTIGAYLLGSVPTSYIAGRLLKGIDVRDHGSGTVSGSNVWHSVARWAVVPVGIFDILKGFIPVYVTMVMGLTLFDNPVLAQGIVGLAAIAGHNWPIFLGFFGGRGISTMMGVLVVLAPWELLVFVVVWLLCIALLRNVPLGAIIAAMSLPLAGWGLERDLALTLCLLAIFFLFVLKRLFANRGTPAGDWRRVVVCRLLFDRDIADRKAWVHRNPSDSEEPPE